MGQTPAKLFPRPGPFGQASSNLLYDTQPEVQLPPVQFPSLNSYDQGTAPQAQSFASSLPAYPGAYGRAPKSGRNGIYGSYTQRYLALED